MSALNDLFAALDDFCNYMHHLIDDLYEIMYDHYEFYHYFNAFIFYPVILIYIFNYIIFSIVKKKTEINSLSLLILISNQY